MCHRGQQTHVYLNQRVSYQKMNIVSSVSSARPLRLITVAETFLSIIMRPTYANSKLNLAIHHANRDNYFAVRTPTRLLAARAFAE